MTASKLRLFGKRRRNTPRKKSKGFQAGLIAWGDRMAFNWKVREALYRHLSAQVGNGVTTESALETFRARLQRRKRVSSDKIIADVSRRMRDGSTLAKALGQWIPRDEIGIITSGELSGGLPRALNLVIESRRRVNRVNRAIRQALRSPMIYMVAVYAMLWTIGAFVTPSLQQALPHERTQGIVSGLYSAGDFANSWFALLPPFLLISLVAAVIYSLPRWTGKHRIWAEQFFPYSFYRDTEGYAWLMSFSALLQAGVADVEILRRQMELASPWLKERLYALWWRMENGSSLSAALLAKGKNGMPPFGFPNPDIADDISSMHGFGDFPEKISVLAMQWAEELEVSTLDFAHRFGFWVEMFMYAVMILMIVAINAMSTQMGNVPGVGM
jgi:type II secretory pathway component PulF